jgi:hypothetical protein
MIEKNELEEMYTRRHLTMAEIGKIHGLTRARISQMCKEYGIKAQQGERVDCTCDTCGKTVSKTRGRWRKHSTHFCSLKCYFADRENSQYRPSRQGQREGRRVMSKHIGRPLTKDEIVHHIDGNCQNNSLKNLILFPSNAAHVRYHHMQRIKNE